MPSRCASLLSVAAFVAASSALAQTVPAPAADETTPATKPQITVRAPPSARVIRDQTRKFVLTYPATSNPNVDQISRWYEPVCVEILGLPLIDQAARIKARIESMSQTLGLPPARADCRPNVEIAFVDDPQRSVDGVAKRLEYLLGYYHLSRTRQLKTVTHPIQAWYVTATRSDGVNTAGLIDSGVPLGHPQSTEVLDDPENRPPPGCMSRFTSCYRSALHNVLIVADNKALVGDKLRLVADDLVMLALTESKSLDGCYVLPSVIDRFAKSPCPGRDPPEGLTSADTAYLTALYSADLAAKKGAAQFDVAGRMAQTLIKTDAGAFAGEGSSSAVPNVP